jgi:hypothetical protein
MVVVVGKGVEGVLTEGTPLRLAFRAREGGGDGGGGVSTEETPPLSHVRVREGGGGCVHRRTLLRLAFRAREGVVVVVVCRQRKHPLRLTFE